jgi:drug/metabolite transporter (DMT)-like permease
MAGHVALVAVQLCFGLLPLCGKWAFGSFDPRAVGAWRIGGGAVLLGGLAFWLYGRRALPERRDLLRLQVCALLGVACNQVLYLEGLERSTAVNAGLLMLLIPVFTYMVAVSVRQERFSGRRVLGMAVALTGAAQLLLQREAEFDRAHLVGNLLIATNALSYSTYLVVARPLTRRYPSLVLIAWAFLLSSWTIPLFAHDVAPVPADASARAWWSLAYIVLVPTTLAYLLNVFALARVAASTTALYVLGQPLIACMAGVLLLGESLYGSTALAAAGLVGGLLLVTSGRRRPIAR